MRINRKDNALNDYIEELDQILLKAKSMTKVNSEVIPTAWSLLTPEVRVFVDDELERCITDRRYFMENYYVIRDEAGRLRTLYPFFSHQEILWDTVQEELSTKGSCRLIVLKPRQAGSTTWNAALITHATMTVPNTFSLLMAQDGEVSGEIYQRVTDAIHNMPWWLVPEMASKQQGNRIIFQRDDEQKRLTDPGLGSTLMISNATRTSGVAIGRTVRNILASEMSRWPDASVWTADIEPSLNAPDMLGIIESTAFGREGLYYNMWNGAVEGDSLWRALFIPVYKVKKYFLPVYTSDKFRLTGDERSLRDNVLRDEKFKIPLGFFKWRRLKVKETIKATGSDETHAESYPLTPEEAFINSGACAFPKPELKRMLRVHCIDPVAIGEIEYRGADVAPELHVHPPTKDELKKSPTNHNRLWIWEYPVPADGMTEYYLSGDVGGGEEGNDFSDLTVYRIGYGNVPHTQVAEWHGHMNPARLAHVVAALGLLYNTCEVAIEYAKEGITTCNELQHTLDYPNIYIWKQLDKIGGTNTVHTHWMTTERTRSDSLNRMNERLLDRSIIIRNKFTVEEMLNFGRFDSESRAQALSGHDDAVMSQLINVGACSQSGKSRDLAEALGAGTAVQGGAAAAVMPDGAMSWALYDGLNRQVEQVDSEQQGRERIAELEAKYQCKLTGGPETGGAGWRVVPVPVTRANTPWSPAFDDPYSAEARIHAMGGDLKRVTPDIVHLYRDMLRRGDGGMGAGIGNAGGDGNGGASGDPSLPDVDSMNVGSDDSEL